MVENGGNNKYITRPNGTFFINHCDNDVVVQTQAAYSNWVSLASGQQVPVAPHKAVAEASKIGHDRRVSCCYAWMAERTH